MDPSLQLLAGLFAQTLAPQRELIKAAETQLKTAASVRDYSIQALKLVSLGDVDVAVRLAVAVNFKNLVKYRWVPSEADVYGGAQKIPDSEKDTIKVVLPALMLATPPLVQAQLSEALRIICDHDFPRQWPQLLPELVARLDGATDLHVVNGVLATANSIFKRYRNQFGSDKLVSELETSQNLFAKPALDTLKKLTAQLDGALGSPDVLQLLLSGVRYLCRIFFSLNSPGLTPLLESQMSEWMANFHRYLTLQPTAAMVAQSDRTPDQETTLDAVRSAVCQDVNLLMEVEEEDFAQFLQTFVADVWQLLMTVTLRPGQDNLAMAAIKFLTSVSRSTHHTLFAGAGTLQQVCQQIVVPNLRVRDEDQEVFDMNWTEYVRRDAEGSDSDTRRRAAADLVKSLTDKFPQEVTALMTQYVQHMLGEYAADPAANWRAKDCAIYLVLALTVRGKTSAQGATATNPLVNIMDFFQTQVLPELQSPAVDAVPMLKADCVKFVTTFRSLLPKEACVSLLPLLVNLLGAESNVVHSYAATAVERLLTLREGGKPRFTPADVLPCLQPLLQRLFAAFHLPESGENEYLMKCVMRVISFVGPTITPVGPTCLQALAQMLVEVCKNPRNPGFNHFLFESVAALIKHGAGSPPATAGATAGAAAAPSSAQIATFEAMLFPAFEHVLQQDVQEFHPYVFQIFAQLIELRTAPLPAIYMHIFPPLLSPTNWERSGNVPALVRLLQAYLTKAPAEVVSGRHLESVLGVFQKLVASKAHDHEGFFVLNSLVECLPRAALDPFMPTIWQLLFTRLQGSKTPKFVRCFLVFLALFICEYGPTAAQASIDTVQAGIFLMLLQQVWLPAVPTIEGTEEDKLLLVATAKLLCDSPAVQAAGPLWEALKESAAKKLAGPKDGDAGAEAEEDDDAAGASGYSTAYAKLANASQPERQVLPLIADPRQYLESSLAALFASRAGAGARA